MIKIKNILPLLLLAQASVAMPLINETFDNGEVSETFEKYFKIDPQFTTIENGRMIFDASNLNIDWKMLLTFPKDGQAPIGDKCYKISFDYETLSRAKNGKGWVVAAIQRKNGKEIRTDSRQYFGLEQQKGTAVLISNPKEDFKDGRFFISPRLTKTRIAIDNLRIEEVDAPQWLTDKDGNKLWGMKVSIMHGNFISQNMHLLKLSKEEFYPFIDKFGQFKHKEWEYKIHSIEDFSKRIEEENAFNEKIGDIPNRDKYFGYVNENYKFKATGRFRTEKVNGKWFLITPEGNLFWSLGVNAVGLYQPTPISKREHYFEDIKGKKYTRFSKQTRLIFKEPYHTFCFEWRNMKWKYGNDWRNLYGMIVDTRARKWGVNTLGCWAQSFVTKNSNIPFMHTANSSIRVRIKSKHKLDAHWVDVPDFFEEGFRERTIKNIAAAKARISNPNCIGTFVDNELPWQNENLKLARGILGTSSTQPAKIKFAELLKQKYETIEALNKAWKSTYESWDNFLAVDSFFPKTKASEADMLKIEEEYYRRYFNTCRDAIKQADANALYISCRFAWGNPLVYKIATEYCDIVAYNRYKASVENLTHPEGAVDKPIIIGEYHFGNQDRGVFGGGLRPCKTMKGRIKANRHYVYSALDNPYIVGVHWFRWADQITSGRQNDGENFSCGMVDICDTPQYDFVMSVRKLSKKMYKKRLGE